MRIDRITARSIPDTRGKATVETTLSMQQGSTLNPNSQGRTLLHATASVPSGKSTGAHEAREIDAAQAVKNVNGEISTALVGRDIDSPDELDTLLINLDGTPDKSRLGANAILSVSMAAMRLFALLEGVPLWRAVAKRADTTPASPRLFVNVMNGGAHADFKLPFQEYTLVVEGETSVALPIAQLAFTELGKRLGNVPFGEEGGYAPAFDMLERPFELLAELTKEFSGVTIAIDAAASELFHDGAYTILGKSYSAAELSRLYENLATRFPLRSIEDPFHENAHSDFAYLTATLGENILIVGDDITVTDPARTRDAVADKEINAVIIKPNQIGTVREAIKAVREAHAAGCKTIASHRSGETEDTFIADFAYGVGAYGIKAGGFGQRERLIKYERLVAIEREAIAV